MKINLLNKNKVKNYEEMLQGLLNHALVALEVQNKNLEVNIKFVNSLTMRFINNKFRKVNKVTDVLSFPNLSLNSAKPEELNAVLTPENFNHDILPETNNIYLGDIIICLRKVKQQAADYNNTFERELGYLTVHGFLHLLGFDHKADEDKAVMRKYEENILEHFNLVRE